jgi:spore coat polysaccharide biosynthesis predicted glycosyltransferase SpsG
MKSASKRILKANGLCFYDQEEPAIGDTIVLQQQTDVTDRQIDRLVYDLYGLTDDEIKLVEESAGQ